MTNTHYEEDLCLACSGSGEGMTEGSNCRVCNGRGVVMVEVIEDEEDTRCQSDTGEPL